MLHIYILYIYIRNELIAELVTSHPAFSTKSLWNPPMGHRNLEVFLSQIKYELFQIVDKFFALFQAIFYLIPEDGSIVIKNADKGLRVVVSNRLAYLSEAENNLATKAFTSMSLLRIKYFAIWWKQVIKCF